MEGVDQFLVSLAHLPCHPVSHRFCQDDVTVQLSQLFSQSQAGHVVAVKADGVFPLWDQLVVALRASLAGHRNLLETGLTLLPHSSLGWETRGLNAAG